MTRTFLRFATLTLAIVCGFTSLHAQSPLASLRPAAQINRVAPNADLGPQTQLTGHIPGWVSSGAQVASQAVDLSANMRVTLVLQRDPAVQAAFEQFLADQQTPGNALYHQWLTPQQVGTLFGPTASDVTVVANWLTSQGLTIDNIGPSMVLIDVHGPRVAVGNAFRTSFAYFSLNGTARLSAISEPSIPTALSPVILSIHGLTDFPVVPQSIHSGPRALPSAAGALGITPELSTPSGNHYVTPGDFATIYDINSVYTGGNKGGGNVTAGGHTKANSVAIIGQSLVNNSDITEWATDVSLTSYNLPNVIIPTSLGGVTPGPVCTFANASTCTTSDDQQEQTLDVDRVIGTAPAATPDLVVASTASGGIYIAAEYNVQTQLDPVMTISYGLCEANANSYSEGVWNTVFSTGAAEGISSFVSSGDAGANGCAPAGASTSTTLTAGINYLCASAYVTCVGGTEFNDTSGTYWLTASTSTGPIWNSALTYMPEGAWNESSISPYSPTATGGGFSLYTAKPSWQTGTGVPADGKRDVPDVSYPAAASHDGYFTCIDYLFGLYTSQGYTTANNCSAAGGYYFIAFGGTSAAAPAMAGVTALLNAKLGTGQGNLNPLLYTLATAASDGVFHDVTVVSSGATSCVVTTPSLCNNSTPGSSANSTAVAGGVQGYLVTAGYDEATGLGSIDVAKFLSAASATLVSTTLALTTVSPNPVTVGSTVTLTATLTPSSTTPGTAIGTMSFYYTPSGGSATLINSAVMINNNVATTTTMFPIAGAYTIMAIYSGDINYATSTSPGVSLTVNAGPSFTATGGAAITIAAGSASGTSTVTLKSQNLFAGTVSFTCTATNPSVTNPGTPTCTATPVTLTASGTGATATSNVTLTTTLGSSGNITLNITGTGTTAGATTPTSATTTVSATVAPPSYSMSAPAALTIPTSGAITGNTTSTTITSTGFVGTVNVACDVVATSGSPYYPASCIASAVTLTSGGNAMSTITISSTPAQAIAAPAQAGLGGWGVRGGVLLATLLCLLPFRRRGFAHSLAAFALLVFGLTAISGCSGSSAGGTTPTPTKKSSDGTYTVTVIGTGTSAGAALYYSTNTTFTLTISN